MKVTEFEGVSVPDGSTKVGLNLNGSFAFYKMVLGYPHMLCNIDNVWRKQTYHDQWTAAIELPEQQEDNADWLQIDARVNTPKGVAVVNSISEDDGVYTSLGNFCRTEMSEYKHSVHRRQEQQEDNAKWVPAGRCVHIYGGGMATRQEEEVNIVGIDKDGFYVFQNDRSTCYYSDPASEFRPLKTDEQKAKEAFDLKALKVYKSCMSCDEFATALFKAGFTAPEGVE
ncbi:MAG: hypothetical protein V7765_21385 [Oleispira sp.]